MRSVCDKSCIEDRNSLGKCGIARGSTRGNIIQVCAFHGGLLRLHTRTHGPMVDSSSNRNEYQGYFLGVKAADA